MTGALKIIDTLYDQLPALAVRQSAGRLPEAHACVGRDPPVVFGHADSFGNKAFPGAGFPTKVSGFRLRSASG